MTKFTTIKVTNRYKILFIEAYINIKLSLYNFNIIFWREYEKQLNCYTILYCIEFRLYEF